MSPEPFLRRGPHPPERVVIDGLMVLRRHCIEDVEQYARVCQSNIKHLERFMPWATDKGVSVESQIARFEGLDAGWDHTGESVNDAPVGFDWQMWNLDETEIIGAGGLMTRRKRRTLEIGLWVAESWCGRGMATAFGRTLTGLAFSFNDVDRIAWFNDAANKVSAMVPVKLGFELLGEEPSTLGNDSHGTQGTGIDQCWVLDRVNYTPT